MATNSPPLLMRTAAVRSRVGVHMSAAPVRLRRGRPQDNFSIAQMVLREKMNPLGLQAARFVVAEEDGGGCRGVGQLKPLPGDDNNQLLELASLVVSPQCRGEGVGSAIVRELLSQAAPEAQVWLLTIQPIVPFYERLGFAVAALSDAPPTLRAEQLIGNVVANLAVGADVVVMRYRPGASS